MNRADRIRLMLAHQAAAKALREGLEKEAQHEVTHEGTRPRWDPPGISAYASLTNDSAVVSDPDAFFDYLEKRFPTEVVTTIERRVRVPDWLTKKRQAWAARGPAPAREGALPDEPPGVLDEDGTVIPGLKFVRGGAYNSMTIKANGQLARDLEAAARRYAIGEYALGESVLAVLEGAIPPRD